LFSIFFEFVAAAIGTAAASARIGAGPAIRRIYLRHYRLINIFLAVTLLECAYNILK
jgi:cysteine/O-acetylserine efflux protein